MEYIQAEKKAEELKAKGYGAIVSPTFWDGHLNGYFAEVIETPQKDAETETPQLIEMGGDLYEIEAKPTPNGAIVTPRATTTPTTPPEAVGLDLIEDFIGAEVSERQTTERRAEVTQAIKQLKNYYIGITLKYVFMLCQGKNRKGEAPTENEKKKRYRKAMALIKPLCEVIEQPVRIQADANEEPYLIGSFFEKFDDGAVSYFMPRKYGIYQQTGRKFYFNF